MSRLVTRRDLEACVAPVFDLPAGALVTPGAEDVARSRGIELRRSPSPRAAASSNGGSDMISGGCSCSGTSSSSSAESKLCSSCDSSARKVTRSDVIGTGWRQLPRLSKIKRDVFRARVESSSSPSATGSALTRISEMGRGASLEIRAGFTAVGAFFVDLDAAGIALRAWSGRNGARGTVVVDVVIDAGASRSGWERQWEVLCARYGASA